MGRIPVLTSYRPGAPNPGERLALLTLVPALATALYYLLPAGMQPAGIVQFVPQFLGYLALGLWSASNRQVLARLGLAPRQGSRGLSWGVPVGLVLGVINSWVILRVVPAMGTDIEFLKATPHAQAPAWLMLPWAIVAIALFVEVNFRGFQMGRWLALLEHCRPAAVRRAAPVAAIGISALLFTFDPFMVVTFRHLHWVALWDGIVWGCLWMKLRNLYATITAHAVEVIVLYLAVRAAFSQ